MGGSIVQFVLRSTLNDTIPCIYIYIHMYVYYIYIYMNILKDICLLFRDEDDGARSWACSTGGQRWNVMDSPPVEDPGHTIYGEWTVPRQTFLYPGFDFGSGVVQSLTCFRIIIIIIIFSQALLLSPTRSHFRRTQGGASGQHGSTLQ